MRAPRRPSPRANSASSSLTKIRNAWNVRVAGWIAPGRECTTRATISASAAVVSMACSSRALTIARATARAWFSSPSVPMMAARSRALALATMSAALGPCRPMRMSSGPSSRNEKPRAASSSLHRRHAEIEHDAVRRRGAGNGVQIREAVFDEFQPAVRGLDQRRALRDGGLIAVDADHARSGRVQDQARVAAGAERRVDIKSAVMDAEPVDGAAAEHGNMTGKATSDRLAASDSPLSLPVIIPVLQAALPPPSGCLSPVPNAPTRAVATPSLGRKLLSMKNSSLRR